jgi:hypothetical protein
MFNIYGQYRGKRKVNKKKMNFSLNLLTITITVVLKDQNISFKEE